MKSYACNLFLINDLIERGDPQRNQRSKGTIFAAYIGQVSLYCQGERPKAGGSKNRVPFAPHLQVGLDLA